jgi:FkbM family methyltransferase
MTEITRGRETTSIAIILKRILGIFLSKLFAKSYYVTQLCRRIVQVYDNDQNAIFKQNGELKLLIHITKISKSDSVFVDVGANVGDYSVELIKAGITGKLFLVDPLNKNLSVANQRILNLNFNNFELIQCALSNSTEKQIFYTNLDDNLSGHDSLYDMSSIGYSEKTEKIEVQVKKFDDVLSQSKIEKIHFLKIDVEGNELYVLKGADNYLTRGVISFIQFEFGNATKAARVYLHDIVFLLESKQYKIFVVKPKGLLPLDFTPFTEMRYSYINLLAVHKNSMSSISNIIISR